MDDIKLEKSGNNFVQIFTIVIGLGFCCFFANFAQRSISQKSWPISFATVTAAKVDKDESDDITWFRIVASYEYKVDGKDYTGETVSPKKYSDKSSAQKEIQKVFPIGKEIQIRYNPQAPEDFASLKGSSDSAISLTIGVGIVVFVLFVCIPTYLIFRR